MNCLITGNWGFIGKHLSEELNKKYYKLGFENAVDGIDIKGSISEDIRTDFLDGEYDIIYHLAALRSVPASFDSPREFFDTNVYGTYRLLTQAKYKKFVNVSSSSAEQAISPYGMSKFLGEEMAKRFENVINVRPFNIFGEGQTVEGPLIRNFCKNMAENKPVQIYGNGFQSKDYTYVKDFVKQLIYLAENKDSGTFEVGYQDPHSVRDIYDFLAKQFGYDIPPVCLGPRKGDVTYSKSIHKINVETYGFYNGLERTAQWWKKQVSV